MSSTAGRLLIAEPMLGDDNFERAVILMIEHDHQGAVGLVINRPSELRVAELVPEWTDATVEPPVIFVGGPVSQNGVIALGIGPAPGVAIKGWSSVIGTCGTVDLHVAEPDDGVIVGLRLFAGYSGWAGGQLEDELSRGAWFVVDASEDDAFVADPTSLWRRILRRQPDELNLLADFPPHPSLN